MVEVGEPALKPLVPETGNKLCFLSAIVVRCLCRKAREVSPPFIVRLRVTPTYQREVVAKAGYNVCWYFRGA
jgi:hypothetical protein